MTKYPNNGLKTEGNYANGVRDGQWAEYWEEVWWYDYGEDGEANTKDTLENNNRWDSVEVVIPDFKPKLKMQGKYLKGNRDGTWTEYFEDGKRKTELNYTNGKFDGLQSYWNPNGNKVEEKNTDSYFIATEGDRCDNLANRFYGDSTLWWFIARVNNLTTNNIPAGTSGLFI